MALQPRRILLFALLLIAGLASAAYAVPAGLRLRADLNADGQLDTAVVRPSSSALQIEVRLSGHARPLFLLATAPVHTLRSADVTGDGRTDLLADSAEGLLLWVNTGNQFVPMPVANVLTRDTAPVAGSSSGGDAGSSVLTDGDSATPVIDTGALTPADDVTEIGLSGATPELPRALCATFISRAPPIA